jgi:hypothetical protein
MIKPRIIVTGATGKTGTVVVSELLKAGYPVRAMVHREDARSARLQAYGAEIAVADLSDFARVAAAALMDPARHAGKSYRPTGPELLGADEMAEAIGRAVGRSVRVVPTPTLLFMKTARMGGLPIDMISGIRYYIDDHKLGVFELGAPTTDVLDVTGRAPEDFETIARRYAALPGNRRTPGNWLREFARFMIGPLSPGFNFDRYDRELRRPFQLHPEFATDSKVWRREHVIANTAKPDVPESYNVAIPPPVAVNGWNSKQETLSCHNR